MCASAAPRGVPRYAHIVVIVEENKDYSQILNPAVAPRISALAAKYGVATHFYGEVHPSEANYVAMLGGDTFGIADDDGFSCHAGMVSEPFCSGSSAPAYPDHTIHADHLGAQLEQAGFSWEGLLRGSARAGVTCLHRQRSRVRRRDAQDCALCLQTFRVPEFRRGSSRSEPIQ